jgi:hypothetical protein
MSVIPIPLIDIFSPSEPYTQSDDKTRHKAEKKKMDSHLHTLQWATAVAKKYLEVSQLSHQKKNLPHKSQKSYPSSSCRSIAHSGRKPW